MNVLDFIKNLFRSNKPKPGILDAVREFHEHSGNPVGAHFPMREAFQLMQVASQLSVRAKQCLAAFEETGDYRYLRANLAIEELSERLSALATCDELAYLDGLADSLYVLVGEAVAYKMPLIEAFDEVHRSNMTKSPSTDLRVRNKGPNYSPPDLRRILDEARSK